MSFCLGLGLSACCGFRIFVPLLVSNIFALAGWHNFSAGFEWLSSWTAFYLLLSATLIEITAYYIPWLDNILDQIALPIAAIVGTLLATSAFSAEISPVMRWGLGVMVGGGSAGLIHAGTSLLRMGSSATTGGIANPVLATAENGSAITFSVLALLIPVMIGILMLLLVIFVFRKVFARFSRKSATDIKS
ncbi:MAG: DUF4126 domain-containing protein [Verrucomicrobia bacterium]|nr:DUF4126 domain-containing protein [Cytophagales bacterium]